MRVAIIGSRSLTLSDIGTYLPAVPEEILTGGAAGIDACAERYAWEKGIPCRVFFPDYARYHRAAPLIRNDLILRNADFVLAFRDGHSRGTKYVIDRCQKEKIPLKIVFLPGK